MIDEYKLLEFIKEEQVWSKETILDGKKSKEIRVEAFGELRAMDKIKFQILKASQKGAKNDKN